MRRTGGRQLLPFLVSIAPTPLMLVLCFLLFLFFIVDVVGVAIDIVVGVVFVTMVALTPI